MLGTNVSELNGVKKQIEGKRNELRGGIQANLE